MIKIGDQNQRKIASTITSARIILLPTVDVKWQTPSGREHEQKETTGTLSLESLQLRKMEIKGIKSILVSESMAGVLCEFSIRCFMSEIFLPAS